MKIKNLFVAMGCAVLLCGCTESTIVNPSQGGAGEAAAPDFNLYRDIEIDMEQLQEGVADIYLDESDYPMATALGFEINEEEEYVAVQVVVKDDTSAEDAAYYADAVVKGINDEYAIQDFSFAGSEEEYFGGLYQEREIRLAVYDETGYEAEEPMYEVVVPKDEYMVFEIEK